MADVEGLEFETDLLVVQRGDQLRVLGRLALQRRVQLVAGQRKPRCLAFRVVRLLNRRQLELAGLVVDLQVQLHGLQRNRSRLADLGVQRVDRDLVVSVAQHQLEMVLVVARHQQQAAVRAMVAVTMLVIVVVIVVVVVGVVILLSGLGGGGRGGASGQQAQATAQNQQTEATDRHQHSSLCVRGVEFSQTGDSTEPPFAPQRHFRNSLDGRPHRPRAETAGRADCPPWPTFEPLANRWPMALRSNDLRQGSGPARTGDLTLRLAELQDRLGRRRGPRGAGTVMRFLLRPSAGGSQPASDRRRVARWAGPAG